MLARRRLLGTAAVGSVAALITSGCSDSGNGGRQANGSDTDGPDGADNEPDPDGPLLQRLVADKRTIIEIYRRTSDSFPTLDEDLRPYLDDHQAHLDVLRRRLDAAAGSGSDAGDSAEGSSDGEDQEGHDQEGEDQEGEDGPADADGPAEALRALGQREQEAAEMRTEQLTDAEDGELARLLAAIAASESLHVDRLEKEQT